MAISLTDLAAAYRAFSDVRAQAIQSIQTPADAAAAALLQQQALVDFLQTRAKLLTDARSLALEQFDAEIATVQQKIGEVRQLMQAGGSANPVGGPAEPAAPAAPANLD